MVVLFWLLYLRQDPKKQPCAHGLKVYPLLGTRPHIVKNKHRFLEWSTGVIKHSPTHTISFKALELTGTTITVNPANVEHILKTNFSNYPKGGLTVSIVEDFLGHGIFNSDGDQWLRQRKAASYEFSSRSLRSFFVYAVRLEVAERLLPLLDRAARDGRTLDVQDVLERATLDTIYRVAFDEDPACLAEEDMAAPQSAEFMRAFNDAQSTVMARFVKRSCVDAKSLWRVKRLLNMEPERRLREALGTIHGYADRIVRERRERGEARRDDFLSRFAASGEHSDVVTNFLVAGRDTTSMTWFFWHVSTRPDVEDKIVRASFSRRDGGGGAAAFGFDELRNMHYLHAAITYGVHAAVPAGGARHALQREGRRPAGRHVHRERVAGDLLRVRDGAGGGRVGRELRGVHAIAYPVFHAGPRMCLGKEMAYIQMKFVAACVLERFSFRFVGGEGQPGHVLSLTLRMKGGLPMQVNATGGSSLSPTQSPTSAAWAILATARPKNAGPAPPYHQSAPVKVPVRPPRKPETGRWDEFDDDDDDFRGGDAAMLPPHEMVARASAGGAGPAAPFSMLEGAGRTLKGRDLRRVRDAVLRQTGFLD
ncbi:hypothetical protein ACP70R_011782 [Stipagrostis hirtigluma subsp. patula]